MEKQVLVKQMFTNGLSMGFPLQAWVKKKNNPWSGHTHWLSGKENVPGTAVS